MYVCVSFHVLTQLGGCMNFSKNERTDQGGSKEASIRFTRLGGLKRVRLQIIDRLLSVHDTRMGFHICIVGYLYGIPVLLLSDTAFKSGSFVF